MFPDTPTTPDHVNAIFPALAVLHPVGEVRVLGWTGPSDAIIPGQHSHLGPRSIQTDLVHEELGLATGPQAPQRKIMTRVVNASNDVSTHPTRLERRDTASARVRSPCS